MVNNKELQIVGYAEIARKTPNFLVISSVEVLPFLRGKGYGKLLINKMCQSILAPMPMTLGEDDKYWLSIYAIENPNYYGFDEIQLNKIDMSAFLKIINDNKFNATYSGVGSNYDGIPSVIDYGAANTVGGDYTYEIIDRSSTVTGKLLGSTVKKLPTTGPQAVRFSHIHNGKHESGKGTFGSANTRHHAHHN